MTELAGSDLPLVEFDGAEQGDLAMAPATFQRDAVENNYWWMRQRRIGRAQGDMLSEMSQRLYGDPNKWSEPPEDVSVNERINYGLDAGAARMFADLDRLRSTTPGDFANYPTSMDDLRERADAQARIEMAEELADANNALGNRSDPTFLGGAASFAGSMAAGVSDVEGVALLPFGAGSGNLARTMLLESLLGGAGAAVQIPAQQKQADFLGTEAPDPVLQVLSGFAFGGALPLAGRALRVGANSLTTAGRVENRELLKWGRRPEATPEERGATAALGREEATADTAREGMNSDDHAARVEGAARDLEDDTVRADDVIPDVGGKPQADGDRARVVLVNTAKETDRKEPIDALLEDRLSVAVGAVYGPGYEVRVYSGGQKTKAELRQEAEAAGLTGNDVTRYIEENSEGTGRHDHGLAADVHIFGPDGKQVAGDGLAPLAQYWAASKWGGVGLEMHGGGIHLDIHETPPAGGAMSWTYSELTPVQRAAVDAGLRGEMPEFRGTPGEVAASAEAITLPPADTGGLVDPAEWGPIRNGIFAGESGADWNALFGYSNRPGGPFEDVKLTEMTVDEALAFADPSGPYGQWVARNRPDPQNGVATPMGAYQIVGTTLKLAKEGLGLKGDELMTPELQEKLGQWIYLEQGTGAWQGYRGPRDSFSRRGPSRYTGGGAVRLGDDAGAAGLYTFDPRTLGVDAATYQFKMGGDQYGVTGRLAGERVWDPNAGIGIMVHERLDGSLYVVDGHQRTGLARRLMDEGNSPIMMTGTLAREADGFTPEMMRAMAAMKNIRQESGSPLDAAKILREDPSLFATIGSRSRPFMLQAEGLAELAPGPFQAVVNDVIPQNYGSIVGRVMPDDEKLQGVAIATLAKAKPANETQAESMIRDIRRLGLEKRADEAQFDMFADGGFKLSDTVISERAQVIDRIMKDARADRALFKRVEQQFDTLQEAGNVLNRTENATRAEIAEGILSRFLVLAEQDGPVRDAIDAAARAIRGGTKVGDAADQVFGVLGRRTGDDAGDGAAVGAAGRGGATEDVPAPRLTELPPDGGGRIAPGLFDDPLEDVAETARMEGLERDLFAALNDPTFDLPVPDGNGNTTSLRAFAEAAREETDFVDALKTICLTQGARP
jgi:hypothetical protein